MNQQESINEFSSNIDSFHKLIKSINIEDTRSEYYINSATWYEIKNSIEAKWHKWSTLSTLFSTQNGAKVTNTFLINNEIESIKEANLTIKRRLTKYVALRNNFIQLLDKIELSLISILESLNLQTNLYAVTSLNELKNQIPNITDSVTNQISEFNSTVKDNTALLDDTRNTLTQLSKTTISEIQRTVENNLGNLNTTTDRNKNELSELRDQLEVDLKNTTESLNSDLEKTIEEKLKNTRKELDDIKNKALNYEKELVDIFIKMKTMYRISGDGKLADYNNKQADIEKKSADDLRTLGMKWLCLPILTTAAFISHYMFADGVILDIEWILTRFLTISISASLAIYILKESASHRSKENLYRQRGTQLATIGAYIADFPDEQEKMKLKTSLVNNFYSFHDGKADTSNVPDLNAQIKEIVTISKSLSKIIPTQSQDKSAASTKEQKTQPTPPKNTPEEEQKETK